MNTTTTPEGYATIEDLARVCRLPRRSVLTAIRKLGVPVHRLNGDGIVIVDIDDWFLKWFPDEVECEENEVTYLPHRGMVTCPLCGVEWLSPDKVRQRRCPVCVVAVRRCGISEEWAAVACVGDGLVSGEWRGEVDLENFEEVML